MFYHKGTKNTKKKLKTKMKKEKNLSTNYTNFKKLTRMRRKNWFSVESLGFRWSDKEIKKFNDLII